MAKRKEPLLPKGKIHKWNSPYMPDILDKIPDLYKNGEADVEVAVNIGISKDTFYRWLKEIPDFAKAVHVGRSLSEKWWLEMGREGVMGIRKVQATIWFANMKNRFGWKDQVEVDTGNGHLRATLQELKEKVDAIEKHEKPY